MDPPEELRGSSRVYHAHSQQYDKSFPLNPFNKTCFSMPHMIPSSHPLFFFFSSEENWRWIREKAIALNTNGCIGIWSGNSEFMHHQKGKRDMTQSASSNHKWTWSCIASFYFRILISESRVSDSSCLGKASVASGFVVLSDTVFRNNSQQGGPEQGLKCHGKWYNMSN